MTKKFYHVGFKDLLNEENQIEYKDYQGMEIKYALAKEEAYLLTDSNSNKNDRKAKSKNSAGNNEKTPEIFRKESMPTDAQINAGNLGYRENGGRLGAKRCIKKVVKKTTKIIGENYIAWLWRIKYWLDLSRIGYRKKLNSVVGEYQCGFRKKRWAINQIFALRAQKRGHKLLSTRKRLMYYLLISDI